MQEALISEHKNSVVQQGSVSGLLVGLVGFIGSWRKKSAGFAILQVLAFVLSFVISVFGIIDSFL